MRKILYIFLYFQILSPGILKAQSVNEKGSATVAITKGRKVCAEVGRPNDRKFHLKAINDAKLASWKRYVSKFSSEKSKLYYQNENKFIQNLDKYIISFDILNSECSEKDRTYSVYIRSSINNSNVDQDLTQSIATTSKVLSNLENQGVVVLVVPRKTTELITFKAKEINVTENTQSNDIDEMIQDSDGSVTISSSSSQRNIQTSGGSTVQKNAKRKYEIGDLNDANSQINNLLKPLKMRTLDAARLESMVIRNGYGPFLKDILDQFSGKIGEYGANISPQKREEVIDYIINLGQGKINYFLLGTIDSGTPRIDPDTGVFKSDVLVNVQLFKIDDFFGAEIIASVGPEIQSAFGETDILSEKAALKKAFEMVTSSLFYKLN